MNLRHTILRWALQGNNEELRHLVITELTRNLLKAVTEDEILQVANRRWIIGSKKLSADEVETLKAEADVLRDSFLWKLMTNEVKYLAGLTMLDKAKLPEDMYFGKAMVYSIEMLNRFLERLAR